MISPRFSTRSGNSASGFTLVELVVAMAIGSIGLAVAASLSLYTARSFAALSNYVDLDQHSQHALDVMSHDIRQAGALVYSDANWLVFTNLNSTWFAYTYDSSTKTLTRYQTGVPATVLLTDCDFLRFSISQRNPTNSVGFSFYPASGTSDAKLIDVVWKCSRQIYGKKVNTESIQTAKIVMRN